jgi:hypothetical protein
MCTMISVFVPRTADVDALEAWSRECGVHRQRLAGPGPARDVVVLGTAGMCDCGAALGAGPSPRDDRAHADRIAREGRTHGWSEAKVARAIEQSTRARRRQEERKEAVALAGVEQWAAFFKGAPARGRIRSIGVFYRDDGRSLSAKDLKEARREQISLGSLEPATLAHLEEGVIYEFATGR